MIKEHISLIIEGLFLEEDKIFCFDRNVTLKYIKQTLIKLRRKKYQSIIILEDHTSFRDIYNKESESLCGACWAWLVLFSTFCLW